MVKIFCGNGDIVPAGYDQLGTRYQCLQKGFGAGLYKSSGAQSRSKLPIVWLIIGIVGIILILIFVLCKRTKEKDQKLKDGSAYYPRSGTPVP